MGRRGIASQTHPWDHGSVECCVASTDAHVLSGTYTLYTNSLLCEPFSKQGLGQSIHKEKSKKNQRKVCEEL